jgi:arachidonate 5-lipoxygenase
MGNKQGKSVPAAGGQAAAAAGRGAEPAKDLPYDQYAFPFENAVFEGGPSSLLPYVGAVRFLEEVGIWRSVVRLGGTGEGALLAALLSIGYNSQQLDNFFRDDLRKLTQDHGCGGCCLGCNVSSTFGWNPNKRLIACLASKIAATCGKSDITFLQVFEKFGKELCIVVTNVSQGTAEYCHHKTTPHLSIITAVRMSLTTPVLQSVVKHKPFSEDQLYVQGGILHNYPIHCYDGWWLSVRPEDSFAAKKSSAVELPATLDSLPSFLDQSRFNEYNNKTLGFVVYDDSTFDQWTSKLEERNKLKEKYILPETKLSKSCGEERLACRSIEDKYAKFATAANKILPALTESMPDLKKLIDMNEFARLLKKVSNDSSAELEIFFSGN